MSHVSSDKPFVEKMAKILRKVGIPVWYDQWEIGWGDRIVDKINEGLTSCGDIMVFLSKASVSSEWVKREINSKLIEQIENMNIRILPIKLEEDCSVPPLLKEYRWVSLCKPAGHSTGFKLIFDKLLGPGESEKAIADLETDLIEFAAQSTSTSGTMVSKDLTCVSCGGQLESFSSWYWISPDETKQYAHIQCLQCGSLYKPEGKAPNCPICKIPMVYVCIGSSEGNYGHYTADNAWECPKCRRDQYDFVGPKGYTIFENP